MNEKNYEAIIEAILFTMGESVELDKIAAAISDQDCETAKAPCPDGCSSGDAVHHRL